MYLHRSGLVLSVLDPVPKKDEDYTLIDEVDSDSADFVEYCPVCHTHWIGCKAVHMFSDT